MRWTKRLIASGEARLVTRDSGGDGPVVILIHGLGGEQRHWDRVARLLQRRCRVITYDQRGHGRSSVSSGYRIDDFTADLLAVVEAHEVERPVLVGHSMGALSAVEAAAGRGRRCRAVVAVDGGFRVDRPPEARNRQRYDADMARPVNRLLLRLTAAAGVGARMSAAELWDLTEAVIAREREMDAAYRRLMCPVLQVLPREPDRVPWGVAMQLALADAAERFRQEHPSVIQVWVNSGHGIPLERPEELAELIAGFVLSTTAEG